jgi:hypothetical protein
MAPVAGAALAGLVRPEAGSHSSALAFPSAHRVEPVAPLLPELADPVEAPASVSREPRRDGAGLGVVVNAAYATVDAIPGRALTAYQRAGTVIGSADAACHLGWQLIAAIGKVESNHGRFGGALMTADGVVHPAILGPQLTGKGGTTRIADTDAGLLDGDSSYDRAVGPMQFIPSTWTVVGVDADADGRRDPQDIDDASLATAVYLCSGTDDLSTAEGQRAAVFRYNHSEAYVENVLGIMAGYLRADPALFRVYGGSGVINPDDYPGGGWTTSTPTATPTHGTPTFDVVTPTAKPTGKPTPTATPTASATPSSTPTVTAEPTSDPSTVTAEPTSDPSTDPSTEPTSEPTSEPTQPESTTTSPTETGTATPNETGTATPTEPTDPSDPSDPTDPGTPGVPQDLLDAWTSCLAQGVSAGDLVAMTACLAQTTGRPADDPAILALLADPPATPPTSTQTQQQPRRRRQTVED